ncbi:uncharacterized protein LOC106647178 [Copidosoma floridanum]|uniref:uncharacterized protein LOC106647178 n=1 Tax=Copidosoma floridanum TaxID=29053 RepID=UPI0006C9D0F9|nr:uncharacterized protein LOC106647178 [Copidosoma floridanum]
MLSDVNNARNSKAAEIAEEYMSSLQELASNSKPHINMLTILAEDYIEFASTIVEAVEAHLQKVQSSLKLAVLYLIDSIIKNVNGVYSSLFANNIVQTFSGVFQKVDENTRGKMWKLRQTWNTIFPADKLLALDVSVHGIDRNWPIATLPSNSTPSKAIIHVNPKFLQQKVQQPQQATKPQETEKPEKTNSISEEERIREELLKKSKHLEELKRQRKLLEQQQKELERTTQALIKPKTHSSDGSSKKSSKTTVPSDGSSKSRKKETKTSESSKTPTKEQKPTRETLNILPKDPRLKTAAAIQNGSSSVSPKIEEKPQRNHDHHQSRTSSKSSEHSNSRSSSKSSLFSASPVKIRDDTAPRSDSSQTTANADLSLIMNDNKSLDNDRIQRSSTSSQKTTSSNNTITANQGEAQSGNSSERSPSRSSLTRGTSSSSSKSKSKSSSSSSSRSKSSRTKSHGETASNTSSSSSTSSLPRKKSSKSRKRSRSPHHHHKHHHHHYHNTPKQTQQQQQPPPPPPPQGVDEEEQFGGSLIVSPPQPVVNAFNKESTSSKQRRDSGSSGSSSRAKRKERSKSRSHSPDISCKKRNSSGDKDEDLRSSLLVASSGVVPAVVPALDSKEDLDLRVLPPIPNKRKTADGHESSSSKKSKDELLDELFGKEDVDLRILAPTPQKVSAHPPTPPPPVISGEKDKDKDSSWAKIKTPIKNDSSLSSSSMRSDPRSNMSSTLVERPERCGRIPRISKIYNKNEEMTKDRRRGPRDYERNSDRNIEIIMKEAAEELNQGTITKSQYNKLIQEVLHMSEDQKLRAAQRKDRESKMWDRGDKGMRSKDHGMHPRAPGPRWGQPWHQPWAHPPFQGHFRPEFRPIGPWQNHPRLFGSPIRPDFHNFHGGFSPRMGPPPMGPNGPIILNPMASGPMNSIGGSMSSLAPSLMMNTSSPIVPKRPTSNAENDGNWSNQSIESTKTKDTAEEVSSSSNRDELPPADPALIEEITNDTMRSINIDNVLREIRYYGDTGVIFMHWDDPRDIGFQNGARRISIDGKETVVCSFNDDYREFTYEGKVHKVKLGAPTRELYVDGKWYQCYFGGQPITIELDKKSVSVKLDGPSPQVKIGTVKRTDLVLGKINLIINARCMVPVFLDAKPQIFHIDNKPCTLEFIDALQTVLINGRPFNVEFGGLPKPILVHEKKHFIRFSVLPRGFRAGYVKIANMKGEQPKELPEEVTKKAQQEVSSSTMVAVPLSIEPDSTSQDGLDQSYTTKTDLQMLSSVVPSAMAPSSGLSYQAEPVENQPALAPAITLPLNLSELYQRLVETGIVSNLFETKKSEVEDKKEPEIVPVSFDKPETLKIKQPAMVTSLYSGIQCSSCGARFAPEMATRYSHHLDWHFRQNRKERDSSRKAHSRLWYYDVSDWIQFEEIEDLEDRAQSWFETERQNMETENTGTEELFDETLQPSVPTGSEDDTCCQVCHEAFVQFYNDEKEEWHLRPAVCFEGKNFHPLCLEDHKEKLFGRAQEEPATLNESGEINEDKDSVKVENEEKKDSTEDIELKTEEPITEEIIKVDEDAVTEEVKEAADGAIKEILDIIEREDAENIPPDEVTEESTLEEKTEMPDLNAPQESILEEKEINEDASQNMEVDTEIKDDDNLTQEEPMDVELEFEDSVSEHVEVDSTQVEVKSTIDGNIELDSSAPIIPAAQSLIKINIIKPLNSPKEPKETKEEKENVEEEKLEKEEPLKPASIKPSLIDRNLSVLPPVFKGEELSALCSIM